MVSLETGPLNLGFLVRVVPNRLLMFINLLASSLQRTLHRIMVIIIRYYVITLTPIKKILAKLVVYWEISTLIIIFICHVTRRILLRVFKIIIDH